MKKSYKILIALLSPLAIASIILTIITINYFNNKKERIFNIAEASYKDLDMTNDFYHYDEIGYKTIIGVDLSEHNKEVDFNKLKEQGIEFAFLRLGWRGYYEPNLHLDKKFEEYYKGAKKAKMDIGIYFFSQAINEKEAIEEAEYVLDILNNRNIDLYIAFDYETIEDSKARTNNLSRSQRTKNARAFLNKISESKYDPMLYTNMYWIKYNYEYLLLLDYPVWFAQYSKAPQFKGKHIIWQYATEMKIDGVSNKDGVDLNLMIKKEDIVN